MYVLSRLQSRALAPFHVPRQDHADADPEHAKDLSIVAEMDPDKGTDHNSQSWDEERERDLFLRTKFVVHQRGRVNADKRDECSKVQ